MGSCQVPLYAPQGFCGGRDTPGRRWPRSLAMILVVVLRALGLCGSHLGTSQLPSRVGRNSLSSCNTSNSIVVSSLLPVEVWLSTEVRVWRRKQSRGQLFTAPSRLPKLEWPIHFFCNCFFFQMFCRILFHSLSEFANFPPFEGIFSRGKRKKSAGASRADVLAW